MLCGGEREFAQNESPSPADGLVTGENRRYFPKAKSFLSVRM